MKYATLPKIFDFFYRLYHAWPRFYEGMSQLLSIGQWDKWQNRVFDDLSGKRVLEIGVGPGRLFLAMTKKGYKVTGIEIRPNMAYEARKRIHKEGIEADIIRGSVYKMPLKDDFYDAIVMTFVLAEIQKLDEAIIEMKRVLKKGGKIIVLAGGMPQDNNPVARILFRMINSQTSLHLDRNNEEHLRKFGFEVTRTDFGPFNMIQKLVAVKK